MDSWREDKTEVILASLNFYKKKKKIHATQFTD